MPANISTGKSALFFLIASLSTRLGVGTCLPLATGCDPQQQGIEYNILPKPARVLRVSLTAEAAWGFPDELLIFQATLMKHNTPYSNSDAPNDFDRDC